MVTYLAMLEKIVLHVLVIVDLVIPIVGMGHVIGIGTKIALCVQKIAGRVLHRIPIAVMGDVILMAGKTVPHVQMIVEHAPTIPHVVMVHVIQIMEKIVVPVLMIVDNVLLQVLIVVMAPVIQKLVNPVVLVRQIAVHVKEPVIGMGTVNLNILKM